MLPDQAFRHRERGGGGAQPQQKIKRPRGRRHVADTGRRELAELPLHQGARGGESADFFADEIPPGRERAGGGVLGDDGRADDHGVLNFAQRRLKVRRVNHPADAPAGESVGLGHRVQRDRVCRRARDRGGREVPRVVVGEILVRLVTDMKEAVLGAQRVDRPQGRLGVDGAGRVVGRDGDDGAGARRDRGPQRREVELVVGIGRHQHRPGVGHGDRHLVVEVIRDRQNHLVPRIGDREHRVEEGLVAAGGDHEAVAVGGADRHAVFGREFLGKGVEQSGYACDALVLVIGRIGGETLDGGEGGGWWAVVHHALPKRDRARTGADEVRDDRDDRGLDGAEPAGFGHEFECSPARERRDNRSKKESRRGSAGITWRDQAPVAFLICLSCANSGRFL